ncbi:hypothetical protein PSHT_07500 [Puccinia striiformis]|uniref:Uncharacterized protein n=1 Tax=Puccinia striiformis TaxID=27350 RepID=A0A2S4VXH2_9BASI|nr:hypothetical protein PSHT_07500 [Puccinia striiformis]
MFLAPIPRRVSTEVNARFSLNKKATKRNTFTGSNLTQSVVIYKVRILIKITASWEGIRAARELEKDHNTATRPCSLF